MENINLNISISSETKAQAEEVRSEENIWAKILPFSWSPNNLIQNIIRKIELGQYKVFALEFRSKDNILMHTEDWDIYCNCIDSFVELGKTMAIYQDSLGTDGNPTTSWKIQTPEGHWFYIIGKYNHVTSEEDIMVFYNESSIFEVIKCGLVTGGPVNAEPFRSLWVACSPYLYPVNQE